MSEDTESARIPQAVRVQSRTCTPSALELLYHGLLADPQGVRRPFSSSQPAGASAGRCGGRPTRSPEERTIEYDEEALRHFEGDL